MVLYMIPKMPATEVIVSNHLNGCNEYAAAVRCTLQYLPGVAQIDRALCNGSRFIWGCGCFLVDVLSLTTGSE